MTLLRILVNLLHKLFLRVTAFPGIMVDLPHKLFLPPLHLVMGFLGTMLDPLHELFCPYSY